MLKETILFLAAFLVLTETTQVNQCSNGRSLDGIKEVNISDCDKPPCKLKRKTRVAIEQTFVPDHNINSLTTSVHAVLLGVPLPFIGVDGSNACDNIYTEDNVKSGCPLEAGKSYVYKNEFPILDLYPKVSLVVYWALVENGKPITCFEAPSKITS